MAGDVLVAGIEYHSVDLYSVAFQKDELGLGVRTVLRAMTGLPIIPQIYVGGEHIGGATETFEAFNDGSLKKRLAAADIEFDQSMNKDAYSLLPTWLHPR